jgi:hypothetical protein
MPKNPGPYSTPGNIPRRPAKNPPPPGVGEPSRKGVTVHPPKKDK